MKRRLVGLLLALSVMMSGCSFAENGENAASDASSVAASSVEVDNTGAATDQSPNAAGGKLYLLGESEEKYYDENLTPAVPSYSVKEDFSNVVLNSRQAD